MRVLGLDLGTKTLGIAVSDMTGLIATGIENFRFQAFDYEAAYKRIEEITSKYDVKEIVIGMPYHMNGDAGKSVEVVTKFKDILAERVKLPVHTMDERWTTKLATQYLLQADLSRNKRKQVIDKMSAVIILQNYLDMKGARKNG